MTSEKKCFFAKKNAFIEQTDRRTHWVKKMASEEERKMTTLD